MKYTAIIREKGTNYYVKRTDSDYTSKSQYAKDCRANGYYVGGIFTDAEIDLIVNGFQSNDIDTWKKSMEFRSKFSERIISCFTDGTLDISEPEQEEEKPEEAAMVRDEYGNEIFVGETIGECQEYCKTHGITGGNGEYIGIGFFTKDRYFEMEDTQEIESYGNWFNEEQEAILTKEVKEASNHENVHNFMRECTLIEIVMKETTKNTEARQPKGRPPPIKQFYQSNFIKKEVRTWH